MEQDKIEGIVSPAQEKVVRAIHQIVDPAVSMKKFDQETGQFFESISLHRSKGIIPLDCRFPYFKVAFCAPHIKPAPIVFTVNIDFTNYDMEPLSVRFINPFSFELISHQELNHAFKRKIGDINGQPQFQPLALELHGLPFICLPGIREYHEHSDHSNDPWLAHRGKGGEGTLGFIIDKLWEYGIQALSGFNIQIKAVIPQVQLGIDITKVPL